MRMIRFEEAVEPSESERVPRRGVRRLVAPGTFRGSPGPPSGISSAKGPSLTKKLGETTRRSAKVNE
jgi:hypothetical protein